MFATAATLDKSEYPGSPKKLLQEAMSIFRMSRKIKSGYPDPKEILGFSEGTF